MAEKRSKKGAGRDLLRPLPKRRRKEAMTEYAVLLFLIAVLAILVIVFISKAI